MRSVGVVGLGTVGGAVTEALTVAGVGHAAYDRYLGKGRPADLRSCSTVFVCVPTPPGEDGALDVTEVWRAVREIAPYLSEGTIVAVKSTVPPGTSDALAAEFADLEFASVPEFLVAARPLETLTKPDRVVIGAHSSEVAAAVAELMTVIAPTAPVMIMRPSEAEFVKLSSNAMLAAKVALANELAAICRSYGVAWTQVQGGVGLDRRIGPDHLTVSPEGGFGGGCLPKDLDGLIASSRAGGYEPGILAEIAAFNRRVRRDQPSQNPASVAR